MTYTPLHSSTLPSQACWTTWPFSLYSLSHIGQEMYGEKVTTWIAHWPLTGQSYLSSWLNDWLRRWKTGQVESGLDRWLCKFYVYAGLIHLIYFNKQNHDSFSLGVKNPSALKCLIYGNLAECSAVFWVLGLNYEFSILPTTLFFRDSHVQIIIMWPDLPRGECPSCPGCWHSRQNIASTAPAVW